MNDIIIKLKTTLKIKVDLWQVDIGNKMPFAKPRRKSGRKFYRLRQKEADTLRELVDAIKDQGRFASFSIGVSQFDGGSREFFKTGDPRNATSSHRAKNRTRVFRGDIDIENDPEAMTIEDAYRKYVEPYLGGAEVYMYKSTGNYFGDKRKRSRYHLIALFPEEERLGAELRKRVEQVFGKEILDLAPFGKASHFVERVENFAEGEWFGNPGKCIELPELDEKAVEEIITQSEGASENHGDSYGPFEMAGGVAVSRLRDVHAAAVQRGTPVRFKVAADSHKKYDWVMNLDGRWKSWNENRYNNIHGRIALVVEVEEDDDKETDRQFASLEQIITNPLPGFYLSDMYTGSGKTTTTVRTLKKLIEQGSTRKYLVVVPDRKSGEEWAGAIGDGASFYQGIEIYDDIGDIVGYAHELTRFKRTSDGQYRFLDDQVIIITHAKYISLFGSERRSKAAQMLGHIVDAEIIDERLDMFKVHTVTYDDLARLDMYEGIHDPLFRWFAGCIKARAVDRSDEAPVMDDERKKAILKMKEPIQSEDRTDFEWFDMGPDSYICRDKGKDNPAPATVLSDMLNILSHEDSEIYFSEKGRAVWSQRHVQSPIRCHIRLDATQPLFNGHDTIDFEVLGGKEPRDYSNVEVISLKIRGAYGSVEKGLKNVQKYLGKGKTLVVGRKASELEARGIECDYITYWGADRGTNAYMDAEYVHVLEWQQLPGFVVEQYESMYPGNGAHVAAADKLSRIIQMVNRGRARQKQSMVVTVPNLGEDLRVALRTMMPGVKLPSELLPQEASRDEKLQALRQLLDAGGLSEELFKEQARKLKWRDVKPQGLWKDAKAWRDFKASRL